MDVFGAVNVVKLLSRTGGQPCDVRGKQGVRRLRRQGDVLKIGSERVGAAAIVSGGPPFLLKTPETPYARES
jgi:hypothetical protein